MSVEYYRESPGKFDSRTLNGKTLNRWTGRNSFVISTSISISIIMNIITIMFSSSSNNMTLHRETLDRWTGRKLFILLFDSS